VGGLARSYGEALAVGLGIDDIKAWPSVLDAVTRDQVVEVAKEVLDRRRAVTGWLMPEEEGTQ
jgi:zinc protease